MSEPSVEDIDIARVLLLAVAITEWDGAVLHLKAIESVAPIVDNLNDTRRTISKIERELQGWMNQWPRVTSPTLTDEQIKEEARLLLTKHANDLDELLNREEH